MQYCGIGGSSDSPNILDYLSMDQGLIVFERSDEMKSGFFNCGLPYARIGCEADAIIIFDGLGVENKAPAGMNLRMLKVAFKAYLKNYSVFLVTRRPGLPEGYTTRDMSDDYARMIKDEFSSPPDIMGLSTGGEIAQHFAADYPQLVKRLILGSTACKVGEQGVELLKCWREWAIQNRWTDIHVSSAVMYSGRMGRLLFKLIMRLFGRTLAGAPDDPSDYVVTIDADLNHDTTDRLGEIKAPTLIVGGTDDVFYPEPLVNETAEGIPNITQHLYEAVGHKFPPRIKRRFDDDVLTFLAEG
ncbi:MAG: hypothetical protein HN416_12955 [Nitrospina sp.]|jgi:pimeloyl-ACP methyl ester carboxylesterase|nr:hypothetical protein [Nitrospina sp.]